MFLKLIACVLIGYLLGSVMSAVLISKLVYREDVRRLGSGNSGATNAARVYGAAVGLFTFLGDFGKAVLASWLGSLIWGRTGLAIAGAVAVIGHSFPVFFRFKGGKGVATYAGFGLMLDWRMFVVGISVFLIVSLVTKRVSAGSISGVFTAAVLGLFIAPEPLSKILGFLMALLVIAMHWQNITRLLNGTEKPFVFGKPKKPPRVK